MFDRLSLRNKLLIALGVPLTALLAVTAVQVDGRLDEAGLADRQTVEVERTLTLQSVADALRTERDVFLALDGTPEAHAEARRGFDSAVAALLDTPGTTPQATLDEISEIQSAVLTGREVIPLDPAEMRQVLAEEVAANDTQDGSTTFAVVGYGPLIERLDGLVRFDPDALLSGSTAQDLTSLLLADRTAEALRNENLTFLQTSQLPASTTQTIAFTEGQIARVESAESGLLSLSNQRWRSDIEAFFALEAHQQLVELRDQPTTFVPGEPVPVSSLQVLGIANETIPAIDALRAEILATVEADAITVRDDARRAAYLTIGAVGVLGLALLGLVLALYRSIRRPIMELTDRSHDIANTELPNAVAIMRRQDAGDELPTITPIAAVTDDEIGDLVKAFNEMSITAVGLAGEQAASRRVVAEMFVNLGRRNQKLLNRLLASLDSLEREEEDPEALEELFRVDHLATRMRRNAESLLVLAGAQSPRQWDQSIEISDVIRAALSEVEDFQRVTVTVQSIEKVIGQAVADLGHLLAELIENALAFSPSEETVDVLVRWSPRGYQLTITDAGIGVTDDELLHLNDRIRTAATSDETPSRYLGLYVVGRLAARHGLDIGLFESPQGGTVARLVIPESLLDRSAVESELVDPKDVALLAASTTAAELDRIEAEIMGPSAPADVVDEVAPDVGVAVELEQSDAEVAAEPEQPDVEESVPMLAPATLDEAIVAAPDDLGDLPDLPQRRSGTHLSPELAVVGTEAPEVIDVESTDHANPMHVAHVFDSFSGGIRRAAEEIGESSAGPDASQHEEGDQSNA